MFGVNVYRRGGVLREEVHSGCDEERLLPSFESHGTILISLTEKRLGTICEYFPIIVNHPDKYFKKRAENGQGHRWRYGTASVRS
jgi:hypothetical protein